MNDPKIRLAISTCPNDTFAFHALMNRLVDWRGLDFEIRLLDIQQLNDGLFAGSFDVAKASFHAAVLLADSMWVLPSGSALGFGVGPLLLSAQPNQTPVIKVDSVTLCPGTHTTATMLFRLFYGDANVEQELFSDIMPRLKNQTADFGVCIHEGRFTWEENGLSLVEDLGTRWENETDSPLPLGGILASKSLDRDTVTKVQAVIRESIEFSNANPDAALPTMRKNAAEFDDDVLMKHVELYVNDWTVDLGEVGRKALAVLSQEARKCGLATTKHELEIYDE
ncbi:1,4-dihydroxy-6-naphthoate synthase [Mariniblastus fucicola]|uniref:1,4-dihydroxy-6-naphthoate synthase n=1 Tax=Mariniblastus fucicola TaxID=980251 RepID=UPI001EE42AF1|nr:1,4-dihydroxy-6-naphthoate synthase [Mariniblastus fucicola]